MQHQVMHQPHLRLMQMHQVVQDHIPLTETLEIAVEESSTDEEPVPPIEGGTDKWGIKELYPTASNGPTWYIREVNDPTTDSLFYYGIYEGTTIKSIGTGVWQVDARSGTQE